MRSPTLFEAIGMSRHLLIGHHVLDIGSRDGINTEIRSTISPNITTAYVIEKGHASR
jgi:hypothetical protein